jgi:hypothetical protein
MNKQTMKDRNVKQVMWREGADRRWRVNEEGREWEWMQLMYFLHMYEYGALQPVKTNLRKGKR